MEDLDEILISHERSTIPKQFAERRLAITYESWKGHAMNVKRFYAGLIGLVLTGGLAACGSAAAPRAAAPRAAVTVTASPAPTVSVTSAPTPTVTKTKTVVVVPARTAYAPAAPALTNCGGVYAGPNTNGALPQPAKP